MFQHPLPPGIPTSQPFRPPNHLGIDYAAPMGTPIYCADDGFVRYGPVDEVGGYGNTVTVEHVDGWESRYAHLSSFAVGRHERLTRGQLVGHTGGVGPGAGFSTGPHLHYELRRHGVAVDPAPLLTHESPGAPATDPNQEGTVDMYLMHCQELGLTGAVSDYNVEAVPWLDCDARSAPILRVSKATWDYVCRTRAEARGALLSLPSTARYASDEPVGRALSAEALAESPHD